jgi:hypothetical protein
MKNSDKPDRIEHDVRNQPFAHTQRHNTRTHRVRRKEALFMHFFLCFALMFTMVKETSYL